LQVLERAEKALSIEDIKGLLTKALSDQQLLTAINNAANMGRLQYLKDDKGQVLCQIITKAVSQKLSSCSREERLLFQLIEAEGDIGLTRASLRQKSGLQSAAVGKVLTSLERKKLVKGVKSILGRNSKIYMLWEMSPSESVVGNAFYDEDRQIDEELVRTLSKAIVVFLKKRGKASVNDIRTWLANTGAFKKELNNNEMESLIDVMICDAKVEVVSPLGVAPRIVAPVYAELQRNGLTEIPCGFCPVFHLCAPEGDITPLKCVYLKEWLARTTGKRPADVFADEIDFTW